MRIQLIIGASYKIGKPLRGDRNGEKMANPEAIWITPCTFKLVRFFSDGLAEVKSADEPENKPFLVDARRLQNF